MIVFVLAEKLGKFVHEVEELYPDEIAEYIAFFKVKAAEEEKHLKRQRDKARNQRARR